MNEAVAKEKSAKSEQKTQTKFAINQYYLKYTNFDCEVPMHLVQGEWKPDAQLDLDVTHTPYSNGHYSVELKLMVNVAVNKKNVFNLKVVYGGVFEIANYSANDTRHLLNSHCPNFIFPFASQLVSQMTSQAGYPTLNLAPVDFEARFQSLLPAASKKKADA